MRPIRLVIQGLRSYRERQEIDFQALTEHGLFGIFGPTGSGKSTILDAITLALFGSATRASRHAQGTVNPLEARMEIVFEFEIGTGARRRRYRVERAFKRGKGAFSVMTAASRLVEIENPESDSPGLVMVAEGANEVDAAIEGILGLTDKDFTRAVVLPQGQFAEFLRLSGTERGMMLERLFGLERYGKKLADKVSQRCAEANQEVGQLEAALAEVGDASEEALARAQAALQEATSALRAAEVARRDAEAHLRDLERVAEIDAERRKAEAEADRLRERADEMAHLEERISRHRRASALMPLVKAWEEAAEGIRAAEAGAQSAGAALQEAEARATEAARAEQEAAARREAEEPALLAQQALLREAEAVERAWQDKARAAVDAEAELQVQRARLAAAQGACAQLEAEAQALRDGLEKAERAFRAHHVPPEVRSALDHLRRARDDWKAAALARAQEAKRLDVRRADVEAAEQACRTAQEARSALLEDSETLEAAKAAHEGSKPAMSRDGIAHLRAWLLRAEERVHELAQAEQAVAAARKRRETVERARAQAEDVRNARANAAEAAREAMERLRSERDTRWAARHGALIAALARELVEGQPCPVCGSTHHPNPAVGAVDEAEPWTDADDLALADAESAWREAEDALREAERQYQAAFAQAEAAERELARAEEERARRLEALAELWPEAPGATGADMPESAEGWKPHVRRAAEEIAAGEEAWVAWEARAKELADQSAVLTERLQRAAGDVLAAEERLKAARAEWERQRASAELAEEQVRVSAEVLRRAAEAVSLGDGLEGEALAQAVEERLRRLEDDDRQAAEADALRQRLTADLAQVNARLQEAEREKLEAERFAHEAEIQVAQLRAAEESDRRRLDEMTGGRPVAEARADVEAALEALRRALGEAVRARQEAEVARDKARTDAAQAEAALQAARRTEGRAREAMDSALAESDFATPGDVWDALLDAREADALEAEMGQYRDAVQAVRQRLSDLERQLAGRRVDEQELAAARARAQAAEAAHGEAQQRLGACRQQLEDLEARRTRFIEVSARLERAREVAGRLEMLRGVLRSNAFVQYIGSEEMAQVARQASERLSSLTQGRYRLVFTPSGEFMMRDDHLGGVERPVGTLSGGETFVTSLSLALALSTHIQLRGQHPLEFFFLDEGFGTLDPDLLDVVMSSLERLRHERMAIGLISHVPELRERVPRRLVVEPAEPGGRGTRVRLERA
ncbi:AAA family ATPase [Alicyclobacillus mali (ex Roth et al. 2021)]|uniref:AAA family ATPase n=1 Tax=Alicyclobacillus mali (ex Roth et al. 2021) TaxID=1123961 RepID=UPI0008307A6F|nr:SMC family ATPase [Alicyclobacillus mali (ex Roth et al. 2021)]